MMERYIIVGLGNIGLRYRNTRHNIGFMSIDVLSKKYNITVRKNLCEANIGEGTVDGNSVVLAKPRTYMNLSGQCIRALVDWYKIDISKLIVIYDDMDLPLGDVRIRYVGSGGSHKGMKSIISHLGKDGFIRIRIGIGEPEYATAVDYVLGRFGKTDMVLINEALQNVANAVNCIMTQGIDVAMNRYNSKKDKGDV